MDKVSERFDPRWPELISDPYPVYARYRAAEPVHWGISPDPRFPGSWYVFGFRDAKALLTDARLDNDARKYLPDAPASGGRDPVRLSAMDAPEHTRLRAVIMEEFTAKRTESLRARVIETVDARLAALAERREFDIVEDSALLVPVAVIADLLGVPAEDRETLRRLAGVVMQGYDIGGDLETVRRASEAAAEFAAYFEQLINARAEARLAVDDLIEHFARAERAKRVERAEIYDICRFLVIAGFETTLNLIGTGIYQLISNPGQLAWLREDPERRIASAVEELLRFVSPVQRLDRYAREELEVGGKRIRRGDSVRIMVGAANYDPAEFADPERLDLSRNPSQALAFGYGRHLCSGAGLARMEAQEAIKRFVLKRPSVRVDPARPPQWRKMVMTRGLSSCPAVA
jgi:cytochrome P450